MQQRFLWLRSLQVLTLHYLDHKFAAEWKSFPTKIFTTETGWTASVHDFWESDWTYPVTCIEGAQVGCNTFAEFTVLYGFRSSVVFCLKFTGLEIRCASLYLNLLQCLTYVELFVWSCPPKFLPKWKQPFWHLPVHEICIAQETRKRKYINLRSHR